MPTPQKSEKRNGVMQGTEKETKHKSDQDGQCQPWTKLNGKKGLQASLNKILLSYLIRRTQYFLMESLKHNATCCVLKDVVKSVEQVFKLFTGHLFRANFQHTVETDIISDLPQDHCWLSWFFRKHIAATTR